MSQPQRISYVIMVVAVALVGWLHMATLLLTAFFGYFALRQLSFGRSKPLGILLFLGLLGLVFYGLIFFSRQASVAFPRIAAASIPAIVDYADKQGIELPFFLDESPGRTNAVSDGGIAGIEAGSTNQPSASPHQMRNLRKWAVEEAQNKVAEISKYVRDAVFQVVYLIIGIVIALSLFLNARLNLDHDPDISRHSLYATTMRELAVRVRTFYRSFTQVMGAQILISAINTAFTGLFLFGAGFPYAPVLTILTFLCGLLPIVGNLISNTVITGVGFSISPKMALVALTFLVVVHKLEYFLNSKIIGDRIKNPMWMTLIGLLVGEKLMGIPGMILAPIVLHYIKIEASQNRAELEQSAAKADEAAAEEIPT
jgi:predicted PurR-regulated permease PerM